MGVERPLPPITAWRVMQCPEAHVAGCRVQSVTLHTNLGDIKFEIFCEQVGLVSGLPAVQCALPGIGGRVGGLPLP